MRTAEEYVKDARNKSILQPIKGLDYFFEQAINAARKEAIDEVVSNLDKYFTVEMCPTYVEGGEYPELSANSQAIENLKNSMK